MNAGSATLSAYVAAELTLVQCYVSTLLAVACVCLSVRSRSSTDTAKQLQLIIGFRSLCLLCHTLCCKEILVLPKITVHPTGIKWHVSVYGSICLAILGTDKPENCQLRQTNLGLIDRQKNMCYADGLHGAMSQSKYCQLLHASVGTCFMTSGQQIKISVMELRVLQLNKA